MIIPDIFAGMPVYRVVAPPTKQHVAKRRGQGGRVRSRRLWIDRVYASPLEPDDLYRIGNRIYAGAAAYAELMKMGASA